MHTASGGGGGGAVDAAAVAARIPIFHRGQLVYHWQQTAEQVVLFIDPPPEIAQEFLDIVIGAEHMAVGIRGNAQKFLDHRLGGLCDASASSWVVKDRGRKPELEITLLKAQTGAIWKSALLDGEREEEGGGEEEEEAAAVTAFSAQGMPESEKVSGAAGVVSSGGEERVSSARRPGGGRAGEDDGRVLSSNLSSNEALDEGDAGHQSPGEGRGPDGGLGEEEGAGHPGRRMKANALGASVRFDVFHTEKDTGTRVLVGQAALTLQGLIGLKGSKACEETWLTLTDANGNVVRGNEATGGFGWHAQGAQRQVP